MIRSSLRTPARAAGEPSLLEAMGEHQVTVGRVTYRLPPLFLVMATQNPIEQEGTYPLPEAQLDRFMFNVLIDYPDFADEIAIVESTTGAAVHELVKVITGADVLANQELVRMVPVAENVTEFAVKLVRATRVGSGQEAAAAGEFLAWGAGPRAAQYLVRGAKTRALLDGRPTPDLEDIRRLAHPVLRGVVLEGLLLPSLPVLVPSGAWRGWRRPTVARRSNGSPIRMASNGWC